MKVNLRSKVFCVFGYRGSGKSVLMHYIGCDMGESCLIYDTLNECPATTKYHSYAPENRYNVLELCGIVKLVMANHKYKLFIIDEANRFCPSKPARLPQAVADLNDWCRHSPYKMGVGFVARRPVQLNQDLTELADYLFIFKLGGKSDIQYLNDLSDGLGEVVKMLPNFHFVMVSPDRSYQVFQPINYDKIYPQKKS